MDLFFLFTVFVSFQRSLFFQGSGAGWNSSFTVRNNFTVALNALRNKEKASPSGFTIDDSWMGGIRCSRHSRQFGGFGGGGAGCEGGGGGGGYIGGRGGVGPTENGWGGWSYFNPKAVVAVLDSQSHISQISPRGKVRGMARRRRRIMFPFLAVLVSLHSPNMRECE